MLLFLNRTTVNLSVNEKQLQLFVFQILNQITRVQIDLFTVISNTTSTWLWS